MLKKATVLPALLLVGTTAAVAAPIDKAMWVGNAAHRIAERDAWEVVVVIDLANSEARGGAKWQGASGNWAYAMFDEAWNRRDATLKDTRAPKTDFAYGVYEALKQGGPAGYISGNTLIGWLDSATAGARLKTYVDARQALYSTFSEYSAKADKVLEEAYELSQRDPVYKDFLNTLVARPFRASLDDKASDVVRRNYALESNAEIQKLINSQGDSASVEAANSETQRKVKDVAKSIGDLKSPVSPSPESDDEKSQRLSSSAFFMAAEERAKREQQLAIERAYANSVRSGAYVVGTLLGGKKGRDLIATANFAADVYTAFSQYSSDMNLMSTDEGALAAAAATTVMMGNVLAAVQLYMTVMGPQKEPPEKVLLESLQVISQQLVDLQSNMNERFNYVDRSLALMYGEMLTGFATLTKELETANYNIVQVQGALDRLMARLDILNLGVNDKLDYLLDQGFRTAMLTCHSYKAVTGKALSLQDFNRCASQIQAFLELSKSGPNARAWSSNMRKNINAFYLNAGADLARDVNLVRGMANELGGFRFTGERANPIRWRIAVDNYASLVAANPGLLGKYPSTLADSLLKEGETLRQDFGPEFSGASSANTLKIVSTLLQDYQYAVSQVEAAAQGVHQQFLKRESVLATGVRPWLRGTRTDGALGVMAARPVLPLRPEDDGYEVLAPFNINQTKVPITSDGSWPQLGDSGAVWKVVLGDKNLVDYELLGIGTLDIRYQFKAANARAWKHPTAAWYAVFGQPSVKFHVFLRSPNGNVRRIAEAVVTSTIEQRFYAVVPDSTHPTFAVFTAPDWRGIAKEKLSFELRPTTFALIQKEEGEVVTELNARADFLATKMREETIAEMTGQGRTLHAALKELDGRVELLRRFTSFVFPRSVTQTDRIRSLLFGTPIRIGNADGYGHSSEYKQPPLLTSDVAMAIVNDVPTPPQIEPTREKTSKGFASERWSSSVTLSKLEQFQVAPAAALASQLQLATSRSHPNGEGNPLYEDGLALAQMTKLAILSAAKAPVATSQR